MQADRADNIRPAESDVSARTVGNSGGLDSAMEEVLQRLRAAENEATALRYELGVLDRRIAALESSVFLRFLRFGGGLASTWIRRAGRLLLHSPLHPLWASLAGTAGEAKAHRAWLAAQRAADPMRQGLHPMPVATPRFSVIVPTRSPNPVWFREALESIRNQNYPNWQTCIGLDGEISAEVAVWLDAMAASDSRFTLVRADGQGISCALNAAAGCAVGQYFVFLDHDDLLEPTALAHLASVLCARPATVVYSDEGYIDEGGRPLRPIFKPGYSPNLLFRCMYMGHMLVVARDAFFAAGGFRSEFDGAQDFDLVLRIVEGGAEVSHIPRVLYHWRQHSASTASNPSAKPNAHAAGARAIADAIRNRPAPVSVEDGHRPYAYRLRVPPDASTFATLIIPSRSERLLRSCLSSIRGRTAGAAYDIVVAHHKGHHPDGPIEALVRLHGASSVDFEGVFNYSAICNLAASRASGSILVFLNDDVQPNDPDWLCSLISTLHGPKVAVAGARLNYPSGTIQHAGIAIGIGDGTGHPGRHLFDSDTWPWVNFTRDVSAVSGACLAVHRRIFEELGGFDESFPVNYNDVDLCLRARAAGYSVVMDADARLTHLEARTRHPGTLPSERLAFFRRWGHLIEAGDPFYSPNLRRDSESPAPGS